MHLTETTVQTFFSFLLSASVSPPPSLVSPFPYSFIVRELIGDMCLSTEFHLTCLQLSLKTMGHSPPPLTAHCRPAGRKLRRIQCCYSSKQCILSLIASVIYCLPHLSYCSVSFILPTLCLLIVAIFQTHYIFHLSSCKKKKKPIRFKRWHLLYFEKCS